MSDSIISDISEPKKRGRKKGFTTGPRPIAYVASAIIKGEVVQEPLFSPAGTSVSKEEVLAYSMEDAILDFQKAHPGVDADDIAVYGPVYDVKGAQIKTVKKRENLNIPITELNFTTKKEPAVWREWKGIAVEIVGHPEARFFIPDTEVTPSADPKKRTKPMAKAVPLSSLTILSGNGSQILA